MRPDVLECGLDLALDLQIKRLGQTDAARLGHALEARGDVDAVAVECAIVLGDHIAQIEADAEVHLPVFGELTVVAGKLVLDIDRRAQRLHGAGELGKQVVAGRIDHAAVMAGDVISEDLPVLGQGLDSGGLVVAHQSRVASHVGAEYCRQFTFGLGHTFPLSSVAEGYDALV